MEAIQDSSSVAEYTAKLSAINIQIKNLTKRAGRLSRKA